MLRMLNVKKIHILFSLVLVASPVVAAEFNNSISPEVLTLDIKNEKLKFIENEIIVLNKLSLENMKKNKINFESLLVLKNNLIGFQNSTEFLKNKITELQDETNLLKKVSNKYFYYYVVMIVITVFTFLWNIFLFLYHKKKRTVDIENGYWYQKVLFPICIDPLIEFFEETMEGLNKITGVSKGKKIDEVKVLYDSYLNDFKINMEKTLRRFYVLNTYKYDFYETVSLRMEDLDDAITYHCAMKVFNAPIEDGEKFTSYSVVEGELYDILGKILGELKKIHIETA